MKKDSPKSFITRLFQFSIGPIAGAFISMITIPLLTWILDPLELGKSGMFVLAQGLLGLIIYLGLDQSFVRDYVEEKKKNKLLFHTFIPSIVIGIFLSIVVLFNYTKVSNIIFGEIDFYSVIMLIISIITMVIHRFSSLILRMEEKALLYSVTLFSHKLLYAIFLYPMYLIFHNNYKLLITANVLSLVLITLIQYYLTKEYWKFNIEFDKKYFNAILKYAFPIIFTVIFSWLIEGIDKISIRAWSTFDELGMYVNALSFVAVVRVLNQAFSTFWAPTSFRWHHEGVSIDRYVKVSNILSFILTVLFFIIIFLKDVLKIIISPEYFSSINLIPLLLFAPMMYLISETTVIGIYFTKRTIFTTITVIIAGIVNLIGNYFLVPLYGATGAAVATAISFIIFFLLRTFFSMYVWKRFNISILLINLLLMILSTIIIYTINSKGGLFFLMIIAFIINRNSFKELLRYFEIKNYV